MRSPINVLDRSLFSLMGARNDSHDIVDNQLIVVLVERSGKATVSLLVDVLWRETASEAGIQSVEDAFLWCAPAAERFGQLPCS